MGTQEVSYDIYWEGPYDWDTRKGKAKSHHVLYQLYGQHPIYGRDVLLYIAMTKDGAERLEQHEQWIRDECDKMTFRLGSLGEFTSWEEWNKPGDYRKKERDIVQQVEALLIYAHQPAYDSSNKSSAKDISEGIRIFNSGHFGQLLPELSYRYYFGV